MANDEGLGPTLNSQPSLVAPESDEGGTINSQPTSVPVRLILTTETQILG
jgi:hypothetical protein